MSGELPPAGAGGSGAAPVTGGVVVAGALVVVGVLVVVGAVVDSGTDVDGSGAAAVVVAAAEVVVACPVWPDDEQEAAVSNTATRTAPILICCLIACLPSWPEHCASGQS